MVKPTLHIKADTIPEPSQLILLMIAGENYFNYALLNRINQELVEFGYYSAEKISDESWTAFLESDPVFSERYFLSAIAYNSAESLLVPSEFYKSEEMHFQHITLYGQNVQSALITEYLPDWKMYNVYRVPNSIHSALSRKFITGKFWNIYSIHLKNCDRKDRNNILVDFQPDEFSVLVFKDAALHLAQTFAYSTPEDVLYYLLKICDQFDISQQDVKLSLSGLIEKDSSIYRELYKYFIYPDFEILPDGIRLADALNIYPAHYYSSISKLAACVL
jgi:Protein of unknown function (DUF3822)